MSPEPTSGPLPAARRSRWRFRVLASIGLGAVVVFLAFLFLGGPRLDETLPNPNGYDALLAAARRLEGNLPHDGDLARTTPDELRAWIDPQRPALNSGRAALELPCRVPLPADMGPALQARLNELADLRKLARALDAQAELAGREGRDREAAEIGLDLIRFGQALQKGGVLVSLLVGYAIESIGVQRVTRTLDRLPADPVLLGRWTAMLREGGETREPIDRAIERDRDVALVRSPVHVRAAWLLSPNTINSLSQPAYQAARDSRRRVETFHRLLIVELALRAYRAEHDGRWPGRPEDLLGEGFPALPIDPYDPAGKPLRFETSGEAMRPYSVGPDGVDDRNATQADFAKRDKKGDVSLNSAPAK